MYFTVFVKLTRPPLKESQPFAKKTPPSSNFLDKQGGGLLTPWTFLLKRSKNFSRFAGNKGVFLAIPPDLYIKANGAASRLRIFALRLRPLRTLY